MYVESVYVTAVGLLALTVLRALEDTNVVRRRVVLTLDGARGERRSDPFEAVTVELRALKAKVLDLDYNEDARPERTSLSFDILFPDSLELARWCRRSTRSRA